MGWSVNQIWIGNNPPAEQLKATEQKAKSFGWGYRLWNWGELTSTFGYFYFLNFLIERLNEHALTFLSKFYMWHILACSKENGIYLDATKTLPFDEVYGTYTFSSPGVYTSSDYTPWFVACNVPEAAELAKAQVIHELDIRYKANGDRMFKFFLSSNYNMIGKRYFQNTLIPIWRSHKIEVYNNINPFKVTSLYDDVPDYLLPSVAYGKARPAAITPGVNKIMAAREGKKVAPVITAAPGDTGRIVIIGEEVRGITDIDVISKYRDLFIHVDTCPLFDHVMGKVNVQHSVYYTDPTLVPPFVQEKKNSVVNYTMILPDSFLGYKWSNNIISKISPRVALACSYKELNQNIPVVLYGYNIGDDVAHGYDVELEEVLLHQVGVEIVPPKYEVLYLIFTEKGHVKQRGYMKKGWLKDVPDLKCAFRFCYPASTASDRIREKYMWPISTDEKEEDMGKQIYAAMVNACRLTFNYLFLLPDTVELNPSTLRMGLNKEHPITFGKRGYEEDGDVLTYDFSSGIGLNRYAVENILSALKEGESTSPELMLAHAIKACGLATMDSSSLPDLKLRKLSLSPS